MAKNPDFLKVTFKDVSLKWPRLDKTYRYNSQKKETEACAPGVQGAGWSVAWEVSLAEAKDFRNAMVKHYNDCRARKPDLPEFAKIFGAKKDDEAGTVTFTASKKAVSNSGETNKAPKVLNGTFGDLEDKAIWSGSQGGVTIFAVPTVDPEGIGGIKLLLDTVVVWEPVYGGSTPEDDFGPARHVSVQRDAPAPQPVQAPTPAPAPAAALADDAF
jgi:hypothetical protein